MKKQFLFLVLLGLLCSVGNVWGIDPVIWNLQKTYSSASESELASSGTNWKYSSNVYTYKKALSKADENDAVIIFGSLYLSGDMRKIIKKL